MISTRYCVKGHKLRAMYYATHVPKMVWHGVKNRKYCPVCDEIHVVKVTVEAST